jgi:peptide methionine sulfoxide reductase MsrB
LENVSKFDIYYDLVSFDHFSAKNNSGIYKDILSKKEILFSEKRYEIMAELFNFIQKNHL